jgi:hypothetical protein
MDWWKGRKAIHKNRMNRPCSQLRGVPGEEPFQEVQREMKFACRDSSVKKDVLCNYVLSTANGMPCHDDELPALFLQFPEVAHG